MDIEQPFVTQEQKFKYWEESKAEIKTIRAKVEVLEEYKNAVIDHFIVAFHGYDESKSVYDNLSLLIAYYQELALDQKVSKEASDLHAKVASADVLVEALETIATESHPELWQVEVAIKALSTYDKLSDVSDDL